MTLAERICAIRDEVGAVRKSELNKLQGFNFRGVDTVVNALSPLLTKHGVVVFPSETEVTSEQVTYGAKGASAFRVCARVTFSITDGNETYRSQVCSESMDSGDKATAKAMSVAYRTFLIQTFSLPTDEPDPDHHIYENPVPKVTLRDDLEDLMERLNAYSPDRDKRRKLVEFATGVEGLTFSSLTESQVQAVIAVLEDDKEEEG